jgi:hypothetical protein
MATGLTVQVVGTTITVTVGGNGEFVLEGVPTGNVELRFSGDGVNATVTIRSVQANEKIKVKIVVSGTTAVVESEERGNSDHTREEVNGVIDSLTGDATAFEFKVGSRLVRGDAATVFFGDGNRPDTFDSLKNGVRVEVKGEQREGYVYAVRIHVNDGDDDEDEDEFEFTGRLNSISGDAPDLTLVVGTTTVYTSSRTVVRRRGDVQTLSALAVGQTLEVEGTQRADGSVDARKIAIEDDEPDGPFEIEGRVGGLKGSCPAVTFSVNGYSVYTNASTVFEDDSCGDLKNGDKVEVKGVRESGGRVRALEVERKAK